MTARSHPQSTPPQPSSCRHPASASAPSRSHRACSTPRPSRRGRRRRRSTAASPGFPHHAPKAKRVIFLYMSGGPRHLETFDYKPKLAELDGKPMPESFTKGQPIAQLQGQKLKVQGPPHQVQAARQERASGSATSCRSTRSSPTTSAIVRSMVTDQINHDPAHTMMNTGTAISGRPSMGVVGHLRPRQRVPTTCPGSSC